MPLSLLSRFDLVFVVRDMTTEEIDRKIANQVIRQAQQGAGNAASKRRGVEQVHSSIKERKAELDKKKEPEASKVWEDTLQGPDGQETDKVLTVDFLRKYIQ